MVQKPREFAVIAAGLGVNFDVAVIARNGQVRVQFKAAQSARSVAVVQPGAHFLCLATENFQRRLKHEAMVAPLEEGPEAISGRILHQGGNGLHRALAVGDGAFVGGVEIRHRLADALRIELHQPAHEIQPRPVGAGHSDRRWDGSHGSGQLKNHFILFLLRCASIVNRESGEFLCLAKVGLAKIATRNSGHTDEMFSQGGRRASPRLQAAGRGLRRGRRKGLMKEMESRSISLRPRAFWVR